MDGTDKKPVYDSNYWLCTITIDENVKVKGQEDAYKTIVTGGRWCGRCHPFLKRGRKQMNAGELKEPRLVMFKKLALNHQKPG